MKKLFSYLSMAAMAAGTFLLGSCQADGPEEDIPFNPFVENATRFGTKSTDIKVGIAGMMGFEAKATRGCDVNGNMWAGQNATWEEQQAYLDKILPYPTQEEKDGIMAYIASNPGGVEWPGWTYYYVQDVCGAHHKYTSIEYNYSNQAKHENIDGTSSMEHLCIKEAFPRYEQWELDAIAAGWLKPDGWVHVNNFNAGKCDNQATHNAVLMNGGFLEAKTLNEYSSEALTNWRLFYWNGNYYLGFDFSIHKGDPNSPIHEDLDADGIYDDWIMKIVPGDGETPKSPDVDPTDDPDDDPSVDPDPEPEPKKGEVEVDIQHQDHKDWNEIKTSIHLRDTVNVRVFIPIEAQYQAVPDDFDIRTGEDYTYIQQEVKEVIDVEYNVAGKKYTVKVQVNHTATGIEILLNGADCAEALRDARGIYGDGITFEIHSYLTPEISASTIWNDILKKVEVPQTSKSGTPTPGQCVTYTYGQIHSAYYEEQQMKFTKNPTK